MVLVLLECATVTEAQHRIEFFLDAEGVRRSDTTFDFAPGTARFKDPSGAFSPTRGGFKPQWRTGNPACPDKKDCLSGQTRLSVLHRQDCLSSTDKIVCPPQTRSSVLHRNERYSHGVSALP